MTVCLQTKWLWVRIPLHSDIAPVSSKEFLDIQATIECRFTLKRVRDMIRTYSWWSLTNGLNFQYVNINSKWLQSGLKFNSMLCLSFLQIANFCWYVQIVKLKWFWLSVFTDKSFYLTAVENTWDEYWIKLYSNYGNEYQRLITSSVHV